MDITSSLLITIKDYKNEIVQDITINITKDDQNIEITPEIDGANYTFTNLSSGLYKITVQKDGFNSFEKDIFIDKKTLHEWVILTLPGMSVYYNGYTFIPISVSNNLVGITLDTIDTEGLAELDTFVIENRLSYEEINKNLESQSLRVIRFPDDLTDTELDKKKLQLRDLSVSKRSGCLVFFSKSDLIYLTGICRLKFKKILTESEQKEILEPLNFIFLYGFQPNKQEIFIQYKTFPNATFLNGLNVLINHEYVQSLFPNSITNINNRSVPTNFLYTSQWNLNTINVESAWQLLKNFNPALEFGNPSITIAICDAGIQTIKDANTQEIVPRHPSFVGKIRNFYDFQNEVTNNNINAKNHGSLVASIAAAPIGINGSVGVAPNSTLMGIIYTIDNDYLATAYKWMAGIDPEFEGNNDATPPILPTIEAAKAPTLFYPASIASTNAGPDIINNSFGLSNISIPNPPELLEVLKKSLSNTADYGRIGRGTLVFFASGNDYLALKWTSHEICVEPKVMAIGASSFDKEGKDEIITLYSNYGDGDRIIQFCAPGHSDYLRNGSAYVYDSHGRITINLPPVYHAITGSTHLTDESNTESSRYRNIPEGAGKIVTKLIKSALINNKYIYVDQSSAYVQNQWLLIGDIDYGPIDTSKSELIQIASGVSFDTYSLIDLNTQLKHTYDANTAVAGLTLSANIDSVNISLKTITLSISADGFLVGQDIFIGEASVSFSGMKEKNTIISISGNTLTVKVELTFTASSYHNKVISVINGILNTHLTANVLKDSDVLNVESTAGFQVGQAILIETPDKEIAEGRIIKEIISGTSLKIEPLEAENSTEFEDKLLFYDHSNGVQIVGGRGLYSNSMGGTSAACPTISGVAALVLSANPNLTWVEVRELIRETAVCIDILHANYSTKDSVYVYDTTTQSLTPGTGNTSLKVAANMGDSTLQVNSTTGFVKAQAIEIGAGSIKEFRVIKEVSGTILKIDALINAHTVGTTVIGGLIPYYSFRAGYGRVDAAEAVKAALNYRHQYRDLVIRDYLEDTGTGITNIDLHTINSPDIWMRNQLEDYDTHPIDYNLSGPNENPSLLEVSPAFTGSGLNDLEVTRGRFEDTLYTIKITSVGSGINPDKFRWKKGSGSFSSQIDITGNEQIIDGSLGIKFNSKNGHISDDQWILTIPEKKLYVYTRIKNNGTGGDDGTMKSLDAWVRFYIALSDGVVPDNRIKSLFLFPQQWGDDYPYNNSDIKTFEGNKTYFLGEVFVPEGTLAANTDKVVGLEWNQQFIPNLNSTDKIFLMVQVSPHDGASNGIGAEFTNNLSYREIIFAKTDFLEQDGTEKKRKIKPAQGASINETFKLNVNSEIGKYNSDKVRVQIKRKRTNGVEEIITFRKVGGTWKNEGANISWANIQSPTAGSGIAASGDQNRTSFEGNFTVTDQYIQASINVLIYSSISQAIISQEKYEMDVEVEQPSSSTTIPTPGIVSTPPVKVFAFTDFNNLPAQQESLKYGSLSSTQYRVNSLFTGIAAGATGPLKAYAMLNGSAIIQEVEGQPDLVNLILKPDVQPNITYATVKYFVYKGLKKSSFLDSSGDVLSESAAQSDLLKRMWTTRDNQNESIEKINSNDSEPIDTTGDSDSSLFPPADAGDSPPYVIPPQFSDSPIIPMTSNLRRSDLGLPDKDGVQVSSTTLLDDIFDNNTFQPITQGWYLGDFDTSKNYGLEILTAYPGYEHTLGSIKQYDHIVTITYSPGQNQFANNQQEDFLIKSKREQILAFVDPAAFFGLLFKNKVKYYNNNKVNEYTANDLYTNVIARFFTKDKVYVDIRNELNNSLNYFGNYGIGSGTNASQIKVNTSGTLVTKSYFDNGWPILVLSNTDFTALSNSEKHSLKLSLPQGNNTHPLFYLTGARFYNDFPGDTQKYLIANIVSGYSNEIDLGVANNDNQSVIYPQAIRLSYSKRYDTATLTIPSFPSSFIVKDDLLDNLIALNDVSIPVEFTIKDATFSGSGINDLMIDSYYAGIADADFTIKIMSTNPDTFAWKKDSGSLSSSITITDQIFALSDNLTIRFGAITGHNLNDNWLLKAVKPKTDLSFNSTDLLKYIGWTSLRGIDFPIRSGIASDSIGTILFAFIQHPAEKNGDSTYDATQYTTIDLNKGKYVASSFYNHLQDYSELIFGIGAYTISDGSTDKQSVKLSATQNYNASAFYTAGFNNLISIAFTTSENQTIKSYSSQFLQSSPIYLVASNKEMNKNGDDYPYFKFTVSLQGINSDGSQVIRVNTAITLYSSDGRNYFSEAYATELITNETITV